MLRARSTAEVHDYPGNAIAKLFALENGGTAFVGTNVVCLVTAWIELMEGPSSHPTSGDLRLVSGDMAYREFTAPEER